MYMLPLEIERLLTCIMVLLSAGMYMYMYPQCVMFFLAGLLIVCNCIIASVGTYSQLDM